MTTPHQESPNGHAGATPPAGDTRVSFTFRAVIGGVEGDLSIENHSAKAVAALVRQLIAAGVQVPSPITWRRTPEGLPICERHQATMDRREKQKDVWHSHKLIDGSGAEVYCRGYADQKLSPGYFIDDSTK